MFNYSNISDSCIKCGKCIPTCTIHQNSLDETTSPRGFLDLLGAYKRGELNLDRNAKDIFESCFLCTNCVSVCPNSLETDFMIENIRAELADKFGIALYKKGFFYLLRHRKVMDFVFKNGFFLKSCGFSEIDKNSITPRFPLPILESNRALPNISKQSFLNRYPERIDLKDSKKRVAIFIGCLANYNYAEVGDALVEILKSLNISIFTAKEQLCCAAPAYFTGDFDTVSHNAIKNIDYFESFIDEVDAILIPEATCSAMIKHDYLKFFHDREDLRERVEKLNSKIFLATEYLAKETNLSKVLRGKNNLNQTITYHDPCHSRKVQNIYEEPRELLSKNFNLVEMSDSNRCCGFGGVTIQSEKFDLAKRAGIPKAKMIDETKADFVSAECSACRMQLTNALYQNEVDVKFAHPLELIAKALRERRESL